jgi:hypothetical protein
MGKVVSLKEFFDDKTFGKEEENVLRDVQKATDQILKKVSFEDLKNEKVEVGSKFEKLVDCLSSEGYKVVDKWGMGALWLVYLRMIGTALGKGYQDQARKF